MGNLGEFLWNPIGITSQARASQLSLPGQRGFLAVVFCLNTRGSVYEKRVHPPRFVCCVVQVINPEDSFWAGDLQVWPLQNLCGSKSALAKLQRTGNPGPPRGGDPFSERILLAFTFGHTRNESSAAAHIQDFGHEPVFLLVDK